ncbi:hypothetical protein CCH79_00004694 [Gambusia affinis]|uniref:Uncharacterized protein n=1 Tax=Gambusia affinis TaxID=33528 RepID=A0A315V0C6_GAMAF|nr:hypothetical protein CCH79_00004694 [Gambusia affinis]
MAMKRLLARREQQQFVLISQAHIETKQTADEPGDIAEAFLSLRADKSLQAANGGPFIHHVDELTSLNRFLRGWEAGFSWLRCPGNGRSINTPVLALLCSVRLHLKQCASREGTCFILNPSFLFTCDN